jgi:hypothetical protein
VFLIVQEAVTIGRWILVEGAVLGVGWPPQCAQRGSAGGHARAGTCTPTFPCCGAMNVEAAGSVLAGSSGEGGRCMVWAVKGKVKILNV